MIVRHHLIRSYENIVGLSGLIIQVGAVGLPSAGSKVVVEFAAMNIIGHYNPSVRIIDFCQKSAERKSLKKYYLYYLLDYGDRQAMNRHIKSRGSRVDSVQIPGQTSPTKLSLKKFFRQLLHTKFLTKTLRANEFAIQFSQKPINTHNISGKRS